ncbi:putative bifunctional diguanylate cyclase/phosphodiesterase [Nitrincola sp.]|uniref:putative bifunctional diguanylate cyclase/phosphodiesterase n=1 Tax=Nitrincola sp. TaxID=1926584 RepID=UPI003A923D65
MKDPRFKGSIRRRLIVMIMLLVSITGLSGYCSFLYWFMSNQQQHAVSQAETVALVLSQDFARLLLLNDVTVAADISAKLVSFPTLKSMVLYNHDGKPVHQYQHNAERIIPADLADQSAALAKGELRDDRLHFMLPASYQGSIFGQVYIQLQATRILQIIQRDAPALVVIGLLMMLASYILAATVEKRFSGPILRLVSFLERISDSNQLQQCIVTRENNEFGKLYLEVNTMLERLDQSQKALQLAAIAFDTPSGMFITDANNRILQVNRAFTEITGFTADECIGNTPAMLKSGRQDLTFYEAMWQQIKTRHYWAGEIWNKRKNGKIYPEYLTIQPVLNDNQEPLNYVAAFIDLSRQKSAEDKLEYFTLHDPLTGLANRKLLTETLEQQLKTNAAGALLCFDLNNFKLVNDSFGQETGDHLLLQIAHRMRNKLKDADLMVRLSADEFALWFNQLSDQPQSVALEAEGLAERVMDLMASPFIINNQPLSCSASVGIAIATSSDPVSATQLVQQADSALHQAKQGDGSQTAFYDAKAATIAREYIQLHTALLQALKNHEFCLYYQPQTNAQGRVIGAEALIRWINPEKGLISPLHFIPTAERSGLILAIGEWVLQTACMTLRSWQESASTRGISLSVNVSTRQFYQEDFIDQVKQALQLSGANPRQLKLELTESLLADDLSRVVETMKALTSLNVQLSLDDFGTGYSSLQYLQRLPLDQIKVDQSFIKDMLNSHSKNEAIVRTVLSLGEAFGFEVMAEGVETLEQLKFLQQIGYRQFQGYYFCRPIPQGQFLDYCIQYNYNPPDRMH